MFRAKFLVAGIVALPILACGEMKDRKKDTQASIGDANKNNKVTSASLQIPPDVSYSIIRSYATRFTNSVERHLEVKLNKPTTEEVLKAIALKLKSDDPNRYDQTIVGYYLPDMTNFGPAWATVICNANIEARIWGIPPVREKLKSRLAEAGSNLVGSWVHNAPDSNYIGYTIYRLDDKVYVDETYKDGSGWTKELIEQAVPQGIRFDDKNPVNAEVTKEADEHWLMDKRGDLHLCDKEGVIFTAKRQLKP